ncbi:MAG TPA: FAD:protein FMN transferase, partial [Thioalkalivibrio sp.]|nr:FAD:protein FMN transferase [Thioalkalivibrio sp.]
ADMELARAAGEAVRQDLDYMHNAWHGWEPGPMGRTNQLLATGGEFSANPSILPLILEGQRLEQDSKGLFNPAMGRLFALWGLHADERAPIPPPEDAEIHALLDRAPSMGDIQVRGIRIRSTNPAVQLDMGGYAKGYGVDRAMERLMDMGVEHAIINAGGDLRAIGQPGQRPWRIGIRHPDGEGVLASLELRGDESVYTSGDYEREFSHEGVRYHHILDPRTGQPARETRSVTVIADNGAQADASATALFVAGPQRFAEIAAAMGIRQAMLVDQQGTAHMTPTMALRIHFEQQPEPPVVIVEPSR